MKRGRKSPGDLTVIVGDFGKQNDSPPEGLTERQAAIWRSIISTEANGLFGTAILRGLLADYCRHKDSSEVLSEIIGTFKPEWIKAAEGAARYKSLVQMRELETRAATSIATKLRLTNQSRYTPQAASTAARNHVIEKKPWEIGSG